MLRTKKKRNLNYFMINRFANRHAISSQKRNILYHQFVKYFHVSNLLQFNKYLLLKPFAMTYIHIHSRESLYLYNERKKNH